MENCQVYLAIGKIESYLCLFHFLLWNWCKKFERLSSGVLCNNWIFKECAVPLKLGMLLYFQFVWATQTFVSESYLDVQQTSPWLCSHHANHFFKYKKVKMDIVSGKMTISIMTISITTLSTMESPTELGTECIIRRVLCCVINSKSQLC
jgi:hypothetical protein